MKNKIKWTGLSSLALAALLVGCQGGGSVNFYGSEEWLAAGENVPATAAVLPESADYGTPVAVHDPSVFYDEDTEKYYAFGSHYAVASSPDLIQWTQEVSDGGFSMLYETGTFTHNGVTWPTVLQDIVEAADAQSSINTTWAPDVMKINGQYYMYVSVTNAFGSGQSAIGRVSARDVMGPYSDGELIVNSVGSSSSQPNCIDPELFYDKEGTLWMVYGSFYGGIYIKQLDETGLPVEEGFGTLLWKGGGAGVEGPFIFYSAETDYYYLMVSEGSLSSNYNMRVVRSKNPDGPYTDITGANVAESYGHGNKLAGNYQWAGESISYAAQGHNSVIKTDGKYFVVYHTRYTVNSGHNLQVNQLYFNEAGWPVLSPNRYVGEEKGTVTAEELAGNYDVIVHTEGASQDFAKSVQYTLAADGTVTDAEGASAGSWTLKQNYYFEITLNSVTYRGVVAPAWCKYSAKGIYCMTATSDTGRAVWLNAAD